MSFNKKTKSSFRQREILKMFKTWFWKQYLTEHTQKSVSGQYIKRCRLTVETLGKEEKLCALYRI